MADCGCGDTTMVEFCARHQRIANRPPKTDDEELFARELLCGLDPSKVRADRPGSPRARQPNDDPPTTPERSEGASSSDPPTLPADPVSEEGRCQTCGSDDPANRRTRYGIAGPESLPVGPLCPDPFHDVAKETEGDALAGARVDGRSVALLVSDALVNTPTATDDQIGMLAAWLYRFAGSRLTERELFKGLLDAGFETSAPFGATPTTAEAKAEAAKQKPVADEA